MSVRDRRMRKDCSFKDCNSNSTDQPDVKFFHFPNNYSGWIKACRNYKLFTVTPNSLRRNYFVCSKHFSKFDYVRIFSDFRSARRLLRRDAIPKPGPVNDDPIFTLEENVGNLLSSSAASTEDTMEVCSSDENSLKNAPTTESHPHDETKKTVTDTGSRENLLVNDGLHVSIKSESDQPSNDEASESKLVDDVTQQADQVEELKQELDPNMIFKMEPTDEEFYEELDPLADTDDKVKSETCKNYSREYSSAKVSESSLPSLAPRPLFSSNAGLIASGSIPLVQSPGILPTSTDSSSRIIVIMPTPANLRDSWSSTASGPPPYIAVPLDANAILNASAFATAITGHASTVPATPSFSVPTAPAPTIPSAPSLTVPFVPGLIFSHGPHVTVPDTSTLTNAPTASVAGTPALTIAAAPAATVVSASALNVASAPVLSSTVMSAISGNSSLPQLYTVPTATALALTAATITSTSTVTTASVAMSGVTGFKKIVPTPSILGTISQLPFASVQNSSNDSLPVHSLLQDISTSIDNFQGRSKINLQVPVRFSDCDNGMSAVSAVPGPHIATSRIANMPWISGAFSHLVPNSPLVALNVRTSAVKRKADSTGSIPNPKKARRSNYSAELKETPKAPRRQKRMSVDTVMSIIGPGLGPVMAEVVRLKLKGKLRYTYNQKWMAVNILLNCGLPGYRALRNIMFLPCLTTMMIFLRGYRMCPGVHARNIDMLKAKVTPKTAKYKYVFLLIGEISLKKELCYSTNTDKILGFEDDGEVRSKRLASSALSVFAAGVFAKWHHPLGYYLASSSTEPSALVAIIVNCVKLLEDAGYEVLGVTSDGSANFEEAFKLMGCSPSYPKIRISNNEYFAFVDQAYLLKSARNSLFNRNMYVPTFSDRASWNHIEAAFEIDKANNFRMIPRVGSVHLHGLNCHNKKDIRLAAPILSNSMAATLNYLVAAEKLDAAASATSSYCKRFNDLFDICTSSFANDGVAFKRPITSDSECLKFLQKSVPWLEELKKINPASKVVTNRFIDGWIQSINVVLQLRNLLDNLKFPFLSVKNLSVDPLEQFYSKIRKRKNYRVAPTFVDRYAKMSTSFLVRAPLGSVQPLEKQLQTDALHFIEDIPENVLVSWSSLEIRSSDVVEALLYTESTCVGGSFASVGTENAASYFCGYLLNKLNNFHEKSYFMSMAECPTCQVNITDVNITLCFFSTFQEYQNNIKPCMIYCSEEFVECVCEYERVFLYYFEKYRHLSKFCIGVSHVLAEHCKKPKLCNTELHTFLQRSFVKCRLLMCIKELNQQIS